MLDTCDKSNKPQQSPKEDNLRLMYLHQDTKEMCCHCESDNFGLNALIWKIPWHPWKRWILTQIQMLQTFHQEQLQCTVCKLQYPVLPYPSHTNSNNNNFSVQFTTSVPPSAVSLVHHLISSLLPTGGYENIRAGFSFTLLVFVQWPDCSLAVYTTR